MITFCYCVHPFSKIIQIRYLRSQIQPKIWSHILKWEHKLIKSFVAQFTAGGGIAMGIGKMNNCETDRICYLRTLDTGCLTSISRIFSTSDSCGAKVITDFIMAASDFKRLHTAALPRSSTNTNLLKSFDEFANNCTDRDMFAYLCTTTAKGNVVIHCHGLNDTQEQHLRSCIDQCIRNRVTETLAFSHDLVASLSEESTLQEQLDVLNTVPAQCFQQRKHGDSLGIALAHAWPASAPKFLLLQSNTTTSSVVTSYCTTIGTKVEQRKCSSIHKGKRKRHCKLHHLFLRKVQEATLATPIRRPFGVSTISYEAKMTPVESFRVAIANSGIAKVITFSDHEFVVVWNNFDITTRESNFNFVAWRINHDTLVSYAVCVQGTFFSTTLCQRVCLVISTVTLKCPMQQ